MVLNELVTNFDKYLMYSVKWGANIKYIPPLNGVYIGYTVCFRGISNSIALKHTEASFFLSDFFDYD